MLYNILKILCATMIFQKAFAISVKTNKNEVSREFDQIENREKLETNIEDIRIQATSTIGSGPMFDIFTPNESQTTDLQNIDEYSLESKGRDARYTPDNLYFNDFETNYTRPGAIAHKKDVDRIIKATEKKLAKLTQILRANGIDCTEVAKPSNIADPYYIELEKEQHKEVNYDPSFCEYLRNQYDCVDNMSIHCEKRNWKYYEWKPDVRWINISGWEARSNGWLYSEYWKKKRFGLHMKNDTDTQNSARHNIASKSQKNSGQIGEIIISARGEGEILHAGGKEYLWDSYKIGYKYREAEEICDHWSKEKWDEMCNLSSK